MSFQRLSVVAPLRGLASSFMGLCRTVLFGVGLSLAVAGAQDFDEQRIPADDFPRDRAIGITHILDPELSRAIGAREFKIWVGGDALEEGDYYLRVARHEDVLDRGFDPELFQNDPLEGAVDALGEEQVVYRKMPFGFSSDPVRMLMAERLLDSDWDYIYELMVACDRANSLLTCRNGRARYHFRNSNRLREYLLKREGVEARFINWIDGMRIEEFQMKASEADEAQLRFPGELEAAAFLFDNDPFGYQYRREEVERMPRHNFRGSVVYQWVRVLDGQVEHGDVHVAELPRPLNVVVCGDSYTSGEGAPLRPDLGRGWFIKEYAGRFSHRSLNSGWELALREFVRENYKRLAINILNVSWSGAEVHGSIREEVDRDRIILREGAGLPGADIESIGSEFPLDKALDTGRLQLWAVADLLKKNGGCYVDTFGELRRKPGSATADIMGFTFGGNDLGFSDLIVALLGRNLRQVNPAIPDLLNLDSFTLNGPDGFGFDDRVAEAGQRLSVMGEKLRNGAFDFAVNKFIVGNYPNPVGGSIVPVNITSPSMRLPLFDATELRWIREKIIPDITEMISDFGQEVGGVVVDTFEVPHWEHTIDSPHPWFWGIASIACEDELPDGFAGVLAEGVIEWLFDVEDPCNDQKFPFSFHPNSDGHYNIYRPLYKEALYDCLRSGVQKSTFESEANEWDLELSRVWTRLVYDHGTSTLRIKGQVSNRSLVEASPSSTIELQAFFENTGTRYEGSFASALKDVGGNTIVLPELPPRGIHTFEIDLLKGEEPCVYYELILSHFLSLQDQDEVRNLIGNVYDSDTLAARLAAWPTLFGGDLNYLFEVKPVSGVEYALNNNTSNEFSLSGGIAELVSWIEKNHKILHEEMRSRAESRGLNSLAELSNSLLELRPELIEIFGLGREGAGFRAAIPTEIDVKDLVSLGERIRNRGRLGILAPELSHLGKEVVADSLTLLLPSGLKEFGAARFWKLDGQLPLDGAPVAATYHQALALDGQGGEGGGERYKDQPTAINAPHMLTGLAGHTLNEPMITDNVAEVALRFAPAQDLAGWSVIDPVSGAVFFRGLKTRDSESSTVDLGRHLFHGQRFKVRVTSYQDEGTNFLEYHVFNPEPGAIIEQEFVELRDGVMVVSFRVTGEHATALLQGFEASIYSETGATLRYSTSPSGLEAATGETSPVVTFLLDIPIDFASSSMRLVQFVTTTDPEAVLTTSLDLSSLRPHLPQTLVAYHTRFLVQAVSDREGEIAGLSPGLLMIDTSEDLRNWKRSLTTMVDGAAPFRFDLPRSASGKLFLRASLMKLK